MRWSWLSESSCVVAREEAGVEEEEEEAVAGKGDDGVGRVDELGSEEERDAAPCGEPPDGFSVAVKSGSFVFSLSHVCCAANRDGERKILNVVVAAAVRRRMKESACKRRSTLWQLRMRPLDEMNCKGGITEKRHKTQKSTQSCYYYY